MNITLARRPSFQGATIGELAIDGLAANGASGIVLSRDTRRRLAESQERMLRVIE